MQEPNQIRVRGARTHNLKGVDIDIPKNALVVITGVSGSGKSSLAFDTIHAEGQRRYLESLSSYARQFLAMPDKPDVDHIEGLSPAIAIEQKTTSRNPRSTVGTVTEIHDYLRLLFARVGVPYSPATGLPIQAQQVQDMVDGVLRLPEGTRFLIVAPVFRDRKGFHKKAIEEWRRDGFQRLRINGEVFDIDAIPDIDGKRRSSVGIVVDRGTVRADWAPRLADSIRTALDRADGLMEIVWEEGGVWKEALWSERYACPVSGFTLPELEPRLFSFNAPLGACPTCEGLGVLHRFDEHKILPDPALALRQGAVAPWGVWDERWEAWSRSMGIDSALPVARWQAGLRDVVLWGGVSPSGRRFEGVVPALQARWDRPSSPWARDDLDKWRRAFPCADCGGHRLGPQALSVRVADRHIGQVSLLSIADALAWVGGVEATLGEQGLGIAKPIVREVRARLGFLMDVGLGYLTLARDAGSLSGGEAQRIRLASQIGSGLTGVLYVLDEPSIGLHQRDNARLLETLARLRDLGNTVLVVEHDEDTIRHADRVFDIGPGAGVHGGHLVAEGSAADLAANLASPTGAYLSGRKRVSPARGRRVPERWITLSGATGNNLKKVDVRFPVGALTCVTGVSGSGKSTLVMDTFARAALRATGGADVGLDPEPFTRLEGMEMFDKVVDIDQRPIGRTPRSNPATYTGAFTPIRDWFAGLPESKARGYLPGRFSFNVKGGRCEACKGDGVLQVEMHFLPDVYVTCDVCKGSRFNRETLEVRHKGLSIAQVLDSTVEEALDLFRAVPSIRDKLQALFDVGLGYVKVGQPATTLSGGEAQRVKLAKELARKATGKTLYIFDEPTTGLHFDDIRAFLAIVHELVSKGNTAIVIEHNLDTVASSDWVVDIGPEGGDAGGKVVVSGTPEKVAACAASHTGRYLAPVLASAALSVEAAKGQKPAVRRGRSGSTPRPARRP
jgi:excinuclease ABC subunit A